jgi:Protein of unknown function (DUF4242)
MNMPRYLIERTYDVEEDEMPGLGQRFKAIAGEQFPELVWEHSHVVGDESGAIKSFCVYAGPSAEMLRDHASVVGSHQIDRIYEIGGDVTPADFPS